MFSRKGTYPAPRRTRTLLNDANPARAVEAIRALVAPLAALGLSASVDERVRFGEEIRPNGGAFLRIDGYPNLRSPLVYASSDGVVYYVWRERSYRRPETLAEALRSFLAPVSK